jgi:hypothetical protein
VGESEGGDERGGGGVGEGENELYFVKGDLIDGHTLEDGWWYGSVRGKEGWFLARYVEAEKTKEGDGEEEERGGGGGTERSTRGAGTAGTGGGSESFEGASRSTSSHASRSGWGAVRTAVRSGSVALGKYDSPFKTAPCAWLTS